ncbi:MAG: hypothetical protein FJX74_22475 [Armatimonadetes bacterium]|nr:hypothetical protein [Armatimonadota bacterium]
MRLVAEFLRYHDLFGSVSTGESNLAALIEPATFPAPSEEEQNEVLSSLLMLNVADAYAAVGKPLWRDKLRVLLKAWLDMVYWVAPKAANLDPVIERPRTRRQLERAVLGECDDTRAAAERLRQTLESSFQTKLPEIAREAMVDRLSTQQLYTAMQTILGAEMAFFPHDLALVCKFDYMLRVVETLTEQWFRSALVQAHRAITEEDGVVDNEGAGPAFRWPRVLEQSAFESAYGASAPSIAGLPRTWTDWEIDEQGAFVDAIAKESLQVELASLPTDQRSRLLERVDIVPLAKAFVAFVYELVRCNRDLCRAREGLERRIVVELLSLSRDDRLRERVSWLMLTTPKEGVVWAADETSAFYFS